MRVSIKLSFLIIFPNLQLTAKQVFASVCTFT